MSRNYNIVYPANGRVMLDGGLDTKFPRSAIPDNESPDCLNVVFTDGAVAARGGTSKLNSAAIGSFVNDGLCVRHDNSGAETMIAFAGGSAWQLVNTAFTAIASATSVFTAGVRVGTCEMENHLFAGNGYVTPAKWNGTNWTRHGVPQATGAVSVASITTSTGALTGDYRYKITYVNSQSVEGDVGTATVTFAAATAKLHLTGIPTAPQSHGVNGRRIYRTEAGGSTFKRVATISDNTTTEYVDNAADASLGTTAPTDAGEPPKYSVIVAHQGRLFMNDLTNLNYVWYTDLYEPFTVKATNFQPVGDASFDLVRGLAVFDNGVIVTADNGCYLWYMPSTDPTTWRVIKTRSPYGSKSPFGSFNYDNKLAYPAYHNSKFVGFAAISGGTLDPDATTLDSARISGDLKSSKIESEMFDVQEAYVANIASIVYKNKAYLAVTSGNGNTSNNRAFVFDFSRSNLDRRQESTWVPITGVKASRFVVYNSSLYYGSALADGFVHQLETSTTSDNGTAVNAYFWTKEFSGLPGHENLQKDFRKLHVLVEKSGAYNMNVSYRTDSDQGVGQTQQIDLSQGTTLWNNFNWGVGQWNAGYAQEEVTINLGAVSGKRIQFKFSNQNVDGQTFKVHGLKFTYNIKGRR